MKIRGFSTLKLRNIAKVVCFALGVSALTACGSDSAPDDTTAPVITLTGDSTVITTVGEPYTDAGVTAKDDVDNRLSIIKTDTVDIFEIGTYTITFTTTDAAGNTAEVVRTVNVADTTAPVITLNGDELVKIDQDSTYAELGATATDDIDESVTVTITGAVDTATPGTYTVAYNAVDAGGNSAAEVVRTVEVAEGVANTVPEITLIGESTITHLVGRPYREFGATAFDAEDGELTVAADTSTLDESAAGSYAVTYSVTDSDGNVTELDRSFVVVDPIDARPFIFTIDTRIVLAPNGTTALTPETDFLLSNNTAGDFAYDFTVDWGDNNKDSNVTDPGITHTYATPGIYTISISGAFHYLNTRDKGKITSIQQWGDIQWSSFHSSFRDSGVLTQWPTDIPDFTQFTITNGLQRVFMTSPFNHDISLWDLGISNNLLGMFQNATEFNQDISKWDTSGVTNFRLMFSGATAFDHDLSNWDFTSALNFALTFNNSGLSIDNYDALLVSILAQATANNILSKNIGAVNVFYSEVGEAAANSLTNDLNWTVGGSLFGAPIE